MRAVLAIIKGMIKDLVRRKDFYVLLVFLLVLMAVMASQNFFQIKGVTRYMRDLGYSIVMLLSFIIAVTFTAKQIPAEIEARTIYPLLAKPLTRYSFIAGKYLGGVVVSLMSFTVFYLVYGLFFVTGGEAWSAPLLAQGFFFGVLFLFMVCAMVIFLSNFMTFSANVTISFLIYIIVSGFSDTLRDSTLRAKGVLSVIEGVIFYIMPHFDFFDMRVRLAHSWDPLPAWVVAAVAVYTLVYCLFLLYFSQAVFSRRKL